MKCPIRYNLVRNVVTFRRPHPVNVEKTVLDREELSGGVANLVTKAGKGRPFRNVRSCSGIYGMIATSVQRCLGCVCSLLHSRSPSR